MSRPEETIRLSKQIIRASAEIEAELTSKGHSYLVVLYARGRDRAAESLAALMYIDATHAEEIRTLQNDVLIFQRLCDDIKAIVAEGIQLDALEMEQARMEAADMVIEQAQGRDEVFGMPDTGPIDS